MKSHDIDAPPILGTTTKPLGSLPKLSAKIAKRSTGEEKEKGKKHKHFSKSRGFETGG